MSASAAALTNVVKDGNFERPVVSDHQWWQYDGGSIGPWIVIGSVDLVTDNLTGNPVTSGWQAAKGGQSLDLNGGSIGSVRQDVATIPGQHYTIRYSLAGNPVSDCGAAIKHMRVLWNGNVVAKNSFDTTGHTFADMGWVVRRYRVTATGSVSRIKFASLTGQDTFCGPALDLVRVYMTP